MTAEEKQARQERKQTRQATADDLAEAESAFNLYLRGLSLEDQTKKDYIGRFKNVNGFRAQNNKPMPINKSAWEALVKEFVDKQLKPKDETERKRSQTFYMVLWGHLRTSVSYTHLTLPTKRIV